jgi:hypothetical protein
MPANPALGETDGTILVGRDAVDSARLDPARFEPHPKRCVDEREIPVGELFAAVLGRVRRECASRGWPKLCYR